MGLLLQQVILMISAVLLYLSIHAHAEQVMICELCGCNDCPPGYVFGNPAGIIPVTQELIDDYGEIELPPTPLNPEPSTLADTLAALGLVVGSELSCALLETLATSGLIPLEACDDRLRTDPVFRENCGCPPLPNPPLPDPTCEDLSGLFVLLCWIEFFFLQVLEWLGL